MNHKSIRKAPILILVLLLCLGALCHGGPPLKPPPPEGKYWLVKDVYLAAGSKRWESFDHTMHEAVNLCFIPINGRNHYVAQSVWTDPSGEEFRTIRWIFNLSTEQRKGEERSKGGAMRTHSMSAAELAQHKPGM
jgi:hypothetical protein